MFSKTLNHGRDETDAVVVRSEVTKVQGAHDQVGGTKIQSPWYQLSVPQFLINQKCDRSLRHPAHISHSLILISASVCGSWKCVTCLKSSADIEEASCYYCGICNFYMCHDCFEPKKYFLHKHDLVKTDVRSVYTASQGRWFCDGCGGSNGPGHFFPRHCDQCKFDLCEKCCQPQKSSLHLHDLYKADCSLVYQRFCGGWRCDCCLNHFSPHTNRFPYHCPLCEFDLCSLCMSKSNSRACRRPGAVPAYGNAVGTTSAGFPVASPEEDTKMHEAATPADAASKCVICCSKPRNATIIHGETGHVCCCLDCARELERRGDPCPICRAPIRLVIQQFLS